MSERRERTLAEIITRLTSWRRHYLGSSPKHESKDSHEQLEWEKTIVTRFNLKIDKALDPKKKEAHYWLSVMVVGTGTSFHRKEVHVEEDGDKLKLGVHSEDSGLSATMTIHEGLTLLAVLIKWKESMSSLTLCADQVKAWEVLAKEASS